MPYAPRLVPAANGRARILLVQTIAGPLAGDQVHVEIEVGPEASLELGANAATLALPADVAARHALHVRLHEGARLAFLQEPVVLAAGCDFVSSSELELADGAAALVRDLVVLGRHAETTGRYRARFRCELSGRPLFHDAVALGAENAASPVVLAGARVYASLTLLGVEPDAPPTAGELALAGPGRVARALAADVPAARGRLAALQPVYLDALDR
jgi:urease accessory protein